MQLLVGLPKGAGRRWARSRYFMLLSDWQNLMHDDSNGIGAVAMTEKFCTFGPTVRHLPHTIFWSYIVIMADAGSTVATTCTVIGLEQCGLSQTVGKGVTTDSCCANGIGDKQNMGDEVLAAIYGEHSLAVYQPHPGVPTSPPGQ